MSPERLRLIKIFGMAGAAAVLAACANTNSANRDMPLIAGADSGDVAASVNRYLWRASLDTIDFMPLANADPMAGIITTDWYGNPQTPTERFKTNVYILDTALRADALRVSVFRQMLTEQGWVDAPINPATSREIENAILSRARELRLNSLDS
ncbi:hypothetical protein PB2503_04722 [Parvularcula bermudensis HTCC2503]|uniref:DUF3576 domain-containing protein n=1 Tax=Parvularcula bermudensis (strain ATCC BAA-594 / HTCC2503 / KCTC 12087) TaxID=314260 RepID=E0TFA1_PARBH|nr:DUF3576 domain-containing protein [Parvularcula bermudensis]ADM09019.1 hypothetical protein PB2503_04722 [Parvularcula bermudensis HTCC2503]